MPGQRRVVETLGLDPLRIRVCFAPLSDPAADLVERRGSGELHTGGVGAEAHVVVRVDEAGQHRCSAGVDDLAGRGGVRVVAHPDDAAVLDRDRLGLRPRRVDGVDAGVADDEVHGHSSTGAWTTNRSPRRGAR